MQIVIDIPENEYKEIRRGHKTFNTELYLLNGVLKGTPIPKGHTLVDADSFVGQLIFSNLIDNATCGQIRKITEISTIIKGNEKDNSDEADN